MPDFNIEMMSMCASLEMGQHFNVGGYEQENVFGERVWPTCTCPAYKFAKRTIQFGNRMVAPECKHIKKASLDACGWHEQVSEEEQTEEQKEKRVCPKCGGPTVYVQVAV